MNNSLTKRAVYLSKLGTSIKRKKREKFSFDLKMDLKMENIIFNDIEKEKEFKPNLENKLFEERENENENVNLER